MSDFERQLHAVFANKNATPYQVLKAAEKWWGSKKAVAEELGVSDRTIQRWMKQGRSRNGRVKTTEDNLKKISELSKTPEIRTAFRAPRKSGRLASNGAKLKMSGTLGPKAYSQSAGAVADYARKDRSIDVDVSAEGMQEIEEAWLTGDPDHARDVTREVIEREYGVAHWDWHDDGLDMKFDPKSD